MALTVVFLQMIHMLQDKSFYLLENTRCRGFVGGTLQPVEQMRSCLRLSPCSLLKWDFSSVKIGNVFFEFGKLGEKSFLYFSLF